MDAIRHNCWVVVPVKELAEAKSRLAPVLTANQRRKLAIQLVEHTFRILHTLLEQNEIGGFVAISNDPVVLQLTQTYRGEAIPENDENSLSHMRLNLALSQASRLCKEEFGATALLILPSDLPLLELGDLRTLLSFLKTALSKNLGVIAPDRYHDGTNALLLRPVDLLDFKYYFGERSFSYHQEALQNRGEIEIIVCERPGLAFDLDKPDDLAALPASVRSALLPD